MDEVSLNCTVQQLSAETQKDCRQRHFRHRLTLLRCFASRRAQNFDWAGKGDLFRCAKDSALISIRLFLSAMGLRGEFDRKSNDFVLRRDEKLLKRRNGHDSDDILIDQLGGELPDPNSWTLSASDMRLLAGVYKRGDKELAHVTGTLNEEFNTDEAIEGASQLIEQLLNEFLFTRVNEAMPDIDS